MIRVDLKNGYYIEINRLNYTLKMERIGKGKDEKIKNIVKTCGHYMNLKDALLKYMECVKLDVLEESIITIEKYIDNVERLNNLLIQGLEDALSRFQVK